MISIDFIGMNYLPNIKRGREYVNNYDTLKSILQIFTKTSPLSIKNIMIESKFLKGVYDEIGANVDTMVKKFNITPEMILEVGASNVEEVFRLTNENYISIEIREIINLFAENEIPLLAIVDVCELFENVVLIEAMFNIELIQKYGINIDEIIELKDKNPIKLYEKDIAEGYTTPVYQLPDGRKVSVDIEFEYAEKDIGVFEVIQPEWKEAIKLKISGIRFIDVDNRVKAKAYANIEKYVNNYLRERVNTIANNINKCENESVSKELKKCADFCFFSSGIPIEKIEYIEWKVKNILESYNVSRS